MSRIEIKCNTCHHSIQVEERFKKVICPSCESSIDVKSALEAREKEKKYQTHISEEKKLKKIESLIKEGKNQEAISLLQLVLEEEPNHVKANSLLFHIRLSLLFSSHADEFLTTDERINQEFWEEVRELVKLYHKLETLCDIKKDLYSLEDYTNMQWLVEQYKAMLMDMELCNRIDTFIHSYLEILEDSSLSKRQKTDGEEYLKKILGIYISKSEGIQRDLTIYYQHSRTKKRVYSTLPYDSLQILEKELETHLPAFKKLIQMPKKEKKTFSFLVLFLVFSLFLLCLFWFLRH